MCSTSGSVMCVGMCLGVTTNTKKASCKQLKPPLGKFHPCKNYARGLFTINISSTEMLVFSLIKIIG